MSAEQLHDPGYAFATVRLRLDQSLDQARETLIKTIESVANEPPSKDELDRAKSRLLKGIELELADTEGIGLDLSEYIASGDWRLLFLSRDRIKAVTAEDVARVARVYFKPSNRTVGEFIPVKSPDRAEIPVAPDTVSLLKDFKGTETILEGEVFAPTPANVESRIVRAKLAGGLRMALLSKKTRGGTVVARVRLDFGDEKSAFGQTAVAQLTAGMLMRGTKNKTRQQIQDETDRLKAYINVGGGATAAVATIETKETNLPDALRLAVEILREPSFPESEFEQLKLQLITQREAQKSQPAALANQELQRRLNPFPRGDVRYVSTLDEQIEDIQKVTLDQVKNFYAQFYGASNAKFVVNGQSDTAQLQKLAADLFGAWKSPGPYTRVPSIFVKSEPGNRKIETPGKENANWLAGETVKMTDDDQDYAAMQIANYIFGGSEASRLYKRIREKEGFSYGVGSDFVAPSKDDGAAFTMYAISAPQNAPKVEAGIRDELARAIRDGFTADEVAAAKKSWLADEMLGRADDIGLLTELTVSERFDRTMKWHADLEAKVAALTPQQVTEAFRRHIDPAALFMVKAGDFQKAGVFRP